MSPTSPAGDASNRARPPESHTPEAVADESLPREVLLMIECARASRSESDREARVRRVIEAPVDWDEVRVQARWHGLTCQLGDALARHAPDLVPADVLDYLRRQQRARAHRNLFLFSRLVHLLELFEEGGIPAIPFKGSVLAHTVYESPTLREFSDLDILVPRKHAFRASALLRSSGFEARRGGEGERRPRADAWERYAHPYTRPADGVSVDLHWHIARATFRPGIRIRRLWKETETREIGGRSLRTFTPEATLLVLCVHGAKHGPVPWAQLKWVLDLDRVLRAHPDLDWDELSDLAGALGCRRILLTGISLAAGLLGAPVSPALLESARQDPVVRDLVERSRISILDGPRYADDARPDIRSWLMLRERWRDRFAMFLRQAVLPRPCDWRLVRLPAWLGFLYVPVRVGRLAVKFLIRNPITAFASRSDGTRPAGTP